MGEGFIDSLGINAKSTINLNNKLHKIADSVFSYPKSLTARTGRIRIRPSKLNRTVALLRLTNDHRH